MKKIYTLGLLLFASSIFAQETISFEENEGYTLGNIQNQNGWEVTESSDGLISNQHIVNNLATDGTFSFKNGFDENYGFQWLPIFGVSKTFEQPYSYTEGFSISYDVYPTQVGVSNFEFTGFGIKDDEYVAIFGLAFDYEGTGYVYTTEDYNFERVNDFTWTPNKWYNVRVELDATEINYYVNNVLIHTNENFSLTDIVGLNIVHDNYGGDAYYDNIKINETDLSIGDVSTSQIDVYPNPVENDFTINLPQNEKIKSVEVYNVSGQKLLESTTAKTSVQLLSKGVYIVKIATENGKSYSKKIIKK